MKGTLPVKNLLRLNLLVAFIFSAFLFLFLILNESIAHPVLNAIMTLVIISIIGFANITILIIVVQKFGTKSVKSRFYHYLFSYPASLAVYLLIWPLFAFVTNAPWSYHSHTLLLTFVIASALINSLIIVSQNFIILQHEKASADLEFSKLKTAHAEAENLLLKQQIHPHFLFNALNTLKSLYGQDIDAGDNYLVHLANFLRASIFRHTEKVSRLDEELSLLEDYLEMQKIRFGTALNFTVSIPPESFITYYLPSFSLQPLLENAIKHNDLTEENPLDIAVFQDQDRIVVSNNLQKKLISEPSTNNGLANLADRYRLLSNDEIIIKEVKNTFLVSIKLLTNEYSDH